MRPAVGVILAAVLAACGPGTGPIVVPPGGGTRASPTPVPKPPVLADELVPTGLRVPWALAFAPDGRLFVTERPGAVLIFESGAPNAARLGQFAGPDRRAVGEAGLRGLALDPA